MTADELLKEALTIRFRWLETFLSVAHFESYEAAAKDVGLNPTTVSRHMHDLEWRLRSPLIDIDDGFILMPDGQALIPLAISILETLRSLSPSVIFADYHLSYNRLLDLKIGDLYKFLEVCKAGYRKKARSIVGGSPTALHETLHRVEMAVGVGPLLTGRSQIALTKKGEMVRDAAQAIISAVNSFERKITTRLASEREMLRFAVAKIRRHLPWQIADAKSDLARIGQLKRSNAEKSSRHTAATERLHKLEGLDDTTKIVSSDFTINKIDVDDLLK